MRGNLSDCSKPLEVSLRGGTFLRRKVPKSRRGHRGGGPFQGQTPPFPRTSFGVRPAAAVSNDPPNLRVATMPVRPSRVVTAWPEQSYPPILESCCNSRSILNAARSLCAVFQSLPEASEMAAFRGPHTSPAEGKRGSRGRRNAFRGESRSSGASEACRLRQDEGCGTCDGEGRGRAAE